MAKKTNNQKPVIKFRTNYNGYKADTDYEKVDPVSITVPNETYSLKDIVERFSREYPKALLRTGYSDEGEDLDFDDFDPTRSGDFDLVDAYELKEQIKQKYTKKADYQQSVLAPKKDLQESLNKVENQPSEV